jgi:ABC-type Fe3+-citrate transport system substrate-binding protein
MKNQICESFETLKSCIDDEMRKSEAIGDFFATFESFDDSEMSEKFQYQEKLIAEFKEFLKKDEEKMNFTKSKFDIELLQKKQSINVEYLKRLEIQTFAEYLMQRFNNERIR